MPLPVSRNACPDCTGRNLEQDPARQGVHFNLPAEQRLAERHRQLAGQVGPGPSEDGVRQDLRDQVEVARFLARTGLAAETDLAAGLDTGREFDLQALVADLHQARRSVEGLLEGQVHIHLGVLTTARALVSYGSPTGSMGAGRGSGPRRSIRTAAGEEVLEWVAGAAASARTWSRSRFSLSRAEEGAKEVREVLAAVATKLVANVSSLRGPTETGKWIARPERVAAKRVAGRAGPARRSRTRYLVPVGSEHVVLLALLGVTENLVGLVDLLEPGLRSLVARILVRVKLARQAPVDLLDFGRARLAIDTKRLVVVLVFHAPPLGTKVAGRAGDCVVGASAGRITHLKLRPPPVLGPA